MLVVDKSCSELPEYKSLLVKYHKEESGFRLILENNILQILHSEQKPIYCDFGSESAVREIRQGYGRKESLFSFIRTETPLRILDSTLGLGRDFFKAVCCGHDVIGLERDLLLYCILKNGLDRFKGSAKEDELLKLFRHSEFRAEIQFDDAKSFLENSNSKYDLIFYDPMFDLDLKSGKAKRGMEFLRQLLPASSEDEVFEYGNLFLRHSSRILVKTPPGFNRFPKSQIRSEQRGKGYKFLELISS